MRTNFTCDCTAKAVLVPTTLHQDLPARQCPDCGAVLIQLNDYRAWRDRRADLPMLMPEDLASPSVRAEEPAGARACPACARPMSRHRVGTSPDFRLDRCSPCQLLWLDGGEWQALQAAGLAEQVDRLLTDAWQRRLQAEENQQRRNDVLRRRLGEEVFAEVQRIQAWLQAQPNPSEILALLSAPPYDGASSQNRPPAYDANT